MNYHRRQSKPNIQVLDKHTLLPQAKIMHKSVWNTAGILKDRYADLKKHLRNVRKGWSVGRSA